MDLHAQYQQENPNKTKMVQIYLFSVKVQARPTAVKLIMSKSIYASKQKTRAEWDKQYEQEDILKHFSKKREAEERDIHSKH